MVDSLLPARALLRSAALLALLLAQPPRATGTAVKPPRDKGSLDAVLAPESQPDGGAQAVGPK